MSSKYCAWAPMQTALAKIRIEVTVMNCLLCTNHPMVRGAYSWLSLFNANVIDVRPRFAIRDGDALGVDAAMVFVLVLLSFIIPLSLFDSSAESTPTPFLPLLLAEASCGWVSGESDLNGAGKRSGGDGITPFISSPPAGGLDCPSSCAPCNSFKNPSRSKCRGGGALAPELTCARLGTSGGASHMLWGWEACPTSARKRS
mmetsp:Transcript_148001/g.368875  ORF Transcript_148001/g.368875 Transcript_148001/m.368875 type:complete len:201 (-) Transcript_148001:480-1082(-)